MGKGSRIVAVHRELEQRGSNGSHDNITTVCCHVQPAAAAAGRDDHCMQSGDAISWRCGASTARQRSDPLGAVLVAVPHAASTAWHPPQQPTAGQRADAVEMGGTGGE